MQWINNLKLMPRLMLAFGIVLLIMLIQGSSLTRAWRRSTT